MRTAAAASGFDCWAAHKRLYWLWLDASHEFCVFDEHSHLCQVLSADSVTMKSLSRIVLVLAVLGGLAAAAYRPVTGYWRERNRINWQTETVSRGGIVAIIESTGTVKPVLLVSIGSFVSGPILEVRATFNQAVKKGDMLARIDPA